ncbi:MAG: hypothetical protein JKY67_10135 [Pseudomonadales bacterium]|nr:hypothetical protein [Pseudomonadales bacterium]
MSKYNRNNWKVGSIGLVLGLVSATTAHATIIGTSVEASMEIRYGSTVDATGIDSGTTEASVSLIGAVTGATAYSDLGFSSLGAESATFDFDIGYDGNGYSGTGYLGSSSSGSNRATIEYTATSNFNMLVDWNFDYSGSNPFGLQVVNLSGGPSEILGDYGTVGHHEGSTSYGLIAGDTYLFELAFSPNVSGGLGNIEGSLAGLFNFNFDSSTSVPEPGFTEYWPTRTRVLTKEENTLRKS